MKLNLNGIISWLNGIKAVNYVVAMVLLMAITSSLLQVEKKSWDKFFTQALNNKTYANIYAAMVGTPPEVVIREVEKEYIPTAEELLLTKYIQSQNTKLGREIAGMIAKTIVDASGRYSIPVELITGVIEKESVFNPSASADIPGKPGEYARGLMMLYQGETVTVERDRAYNLGYNVDLGCQILNHKLKTVNGDLDKALSNYSGRATNYSEDVLRNVGKFTMYKWRQGVKDQAVAMAATE